MGRILGIAVAMVVGAGLLLGGWLAGRESVPPAKQETRSEDHGGGFQSGPAGGGFSIR